MRPAAARDLVERLADDPAPLLRALATPARRSGSTATSSSPTSPGTTTAASTFIDWQMTLRAPVAVELGWFIVTNSAELPLPPDEVLRRYREAIDRVAGRWRFGDRRHDADALLGDWAPRSTWR